jgi:predicted phage terminase large subunit-like protein
VAASQPEGGEEVKRWNAPYLAGLLEYLDTAPMQAALDEYNRLISAPEGDDWLIAELGRQDLFYLVARLLRRPDIAHPWLYARCREVEKEPDEHLDLWAREHYKSTIITFGLTTQDILRDPEVTFGFLSHSRPIAKGFLRQVKTELEVNADLKALYPDVLWASPKQDSPKWSEDDGIIVRRKGNQKEATVEAWGLVDGQPTSKHFSHLVYDDVVTKESVGTPDMMLKTTGALELSFSLGQEGGVKRWVGTRYHFNDSYRTVISRGTAKVRQYDGTEKNDANIKRPAIWSPETMAEKRRDMGIYTFGCQILQNPRADATHGFQRGWLEYWTPDAGEGLVKYILRDPASKKKAQSDYTFDWVIGMGEDENAYVLAMYRLRMNLTQRTKHLMDLHRKWKPLEVRYEEYGLQADIEHIHTVMKAEKYRFDIIKVAGRLSKDDRIKRLIPFFENHRIILPTSFHVTDDGQTRDMVHDFIEDEYTAFPVPAHDDGLDSLSRITDTKGKRVRANGDEEDVDLVLKFPEKKKPKFRIPPTVPLDPVVGI